MKMKNWKTPPHSAGPDSAHGLGTTGLAHGHFGLAGVADGSTCTRAERPLWCGSPLTYRATWSCRPWPARWGVRALTEATWHRRGRRNGVDNCVRQRWWRSSDRLRLRWCLSQAETVAATQNLVVLAALRSLEADMRQRGKRGGSRDRSRRRGESTGNWVSSLS
jgi:hypothetical protein